MVINKGKQRFAQLFYCVVSKEFTYFITLLNIIHHPNFYLKHDVSEIVLCLRLEVQPTLFSH
jgi:hypothetical protein